MNIDDITVELHEAETSGVAAECCLKYIQMAQKILQELKVAKEELEEEARLSGMGASREAKLLGQIERLEREKMAYREVARRFTFFTIERVDEEAKCFFGIGGEVKKYTVRFKIQNAIDRSNMITAFANAGYKVWIEEVKTGVLSIDYFVCIEFPS